jgi:hypothetical protein
MTNTQTIKVSEIALKVIGLVKNAVFGSLTGVSFFSIRNYTNKFGETSNQLINVGINYVKSKLEDIELLRKLDVTTLTDFKSSKLELEKARVALILAFEKPNENISNAQQDAYTIIAPGIKVHNETGKLYIYGYRVNKTVLVEGDYPIVKSKVETIAKNELRGLLKTDKFVNFSIEVGNELRAKGETIEL